MKLTKHTHACLLLDNGQSRLLIDPGEMVELPKDLSNISAVVVSHQHFDHLDLDKLAKVVSANPKLEIITTKAVAAQLTEAGLKHQAVEGRQQLSVGGFNLQLIEVAHAPIYQDSPCQVITIGVDDFLYYPSDSFVPSQQPYQVLALPTSGPWLKLAEVIDLAKASKSQFVVPTHNYYLTEGGQESAHGRISQLALEADNRQLIYLKDGQSQTF